jgi:hypothetical protein
LTVTALSVTGSDFALNQGPVLPAVIPPGTSLAINVTYQPTSEAVATGSLLIENNAPNSPSVTVPLSGTGTPALAQE